MTTARVLLTAAAARLRAAGVASSRVDAELLLAHCLGVDRSRLPLVDAVPAVRGAGGQVRRRGARDVRVRELPAAPAAPAR